VSLFLRYNEKAAMTHGDTIAVRKKKGEGRSLILSLIIDPSPHAMIIKM
jgi:hypothetical protein